MKIALFSAFYPYRGGIAQFSAMLYRALEKDNEIKAYTFKRQYPDILFPGTSQFVKEGDKADVIPAKRVLDSINPITYSATAKEINAFNPELFISQYWMTFFGPSIGSISRRLNKETKRVSIIHNMIPHEKRFFDSFANKLFLKNNDGFVVMSDIVRDDLLKLKPDAKYIRINHPVYSNFGEKLKRKDALDLLNLPDENKYLLFFGIIRDYKGLDVLLQAMRSLPSNYHLIVAGEVYGSFDKYARLIDQMNIEKRIHLFNRYIPDDDVALYFSASDVCVLPYKGATQSGITAISNHFELPSIATDVGGLKENVIHGETGLIVKEPNAELIAESVKNFFEAQLGQRLSANIASIKAENNWEKFAQSVLEFAKSL